jgi:hypothetical protein
MRYFHRTSLGLDAVLREADTYFGATLASEDAGPRRRAYRGSIGRIQVGVEAEGGHYTRITVETDQVGESEADKVAKRFLSVVHAKVEPDHEVRGAY